MKDEDIDDLKLIDALGLSSCGDLLRGVGKFNRHLADEFARAREILQNPDLILGVSGIVDVSPADIANLANNWISDEEMRPLFEDYMIIDKKDPDSILVPGNPGFIWALYYTGPDLLTGMRPTKKRAFQTALRLVHHPPFNCMWQSAAELLARKWAKSDTVCD